MKVRIEAFGKTAINLPEITKDTLPGSVTSLDSEGREKMLIFGVNKEGGFLWRTKNQENFILSDIHIDLVNLQATQVAWGNIEVIRDKMPEGSELKFRFLHRSGIMSELILEV